MATKFIENWVNLNFSPNWLCGEKLRRIAPILRKKHLQGVGNTLNSRIATTSSKYPSVFVSFFSQFIYFVNIDRDAMLLRDNAAEQ